MVLLPQNFELACIEFDATALAAALNTTQIILKLSKNPVRGLGSKNVQYLTFYLKT